MPACDGPLNFTRLMEARDPSPPSAPGHNPFNLPVTAKILETVQTDLSDVRTMADATDGQLSPNFLTALGSRVELGAVNRMDRQFIKDPTAGLTRKLLLCGEVSLVYSYSIRDGKQTSRLPVTMNMVFPRCRRGTSRQRRWTARRSPNAGSMRSESRRGERRNSRPPTSSITRMGRWPTSTAAI